MELHPSLPACGCVFSSSPAVGAREKERGSECVIASLSACLWVCFFPPQLPSAHATEKSQAFFNYENENANCVQTKQPIKIARTPLKSA